MNRRDPSAGPVYPWHSRTTMFRSLPAWRHASASRSAIGSPERGQTGRRRTASAAACRRCCRRRWIHAVPVPVAPGGAGDQGVGQPLCPVEGVLPAHRLAQARRRAQGHDGQGDHAGHAPRRPDYTAAAQMGPGPGRSPSRRIQNRRWLPCRRPSMMSDRSACCPSSARPHASPAPSTGPRAGSVSELPRGAGATTATSSTTNPRRTSGSGRSEDTGDEPSTADANPPSSPDNGTFTADILAERQGRARMGLGAPEFEMNPLSFCLRIRTAGKSRRF